MTPTKSVLNQIQQIETRFHKPNMEEQKLNMCEEFIDSLMQSDLVDKEVKWKIRTFLINLNNV